jgi:hypothetical protein
MTLRKTLLAASAAALMSTPAWALPSQASSHATGHPPSTTPVGPPSTTPVGPPSTTPNDTDNGRGTAKHPSSPGHHGNSHKCKAHKVAFIVSGTLVTKKTPITTSLKKNSDGTYSGEVTIIVTHTNHHAVGEKEPPEKTYSVTDVHVTFGLADTNKDGSVGLDDLMEGDSVRLIGKITTLAKKCDQKGFTPEKTIRKVVFT